MYRMMFNSSVKPLMLRNYVKVRNFHLLRPSISNSLLQKSMSLKNNILSSDETKPKDDLIKTLSEQLILETNLNLNKPTFAENQVDTMRLATSLIKNGYTEKQALAIINVFIKILNDEFYSDYHEMYLTDFEIDKQVHLFNSLQSEIQYIIQNSRDTQMNQHHLQIRLLERDLDSDFDGINEMIIDKLKKDSQLDFNNQKNDNTLLYKLLNLKLRDCNNKITIKINAEMKSDIENLRWHTTRSGLLAIVVLVSLVLTGSNVSSKRAQTTAATEPTGEQNPAVTESIGEQKQRSNDKIAEQADSD